RGLCGYIMHLWSTVVLDAWTDCSPFINPTFDSVVELIRDVAAKAPTGAWVSGKLFDPSLYPGEPALTSEILDRIAPDNPVIIANASQHFLYVNSKALGAAGINDQTPDPQGGSY